MLAVSSGKEDDGLSALVADTGTFMDLVEGGSCWSVLGPGLSLSSRAFWWGWRGRMVEYLALGGWRRREWWGYHEGVCAANQQREHSPITHAELGLSW